MDYILRHPLTSDDVDFINNSSMDIEIHNPNVTGNDSGWRDAATGCRIVSHGDRAIFHNVSELDLLMLKLKYGDRIKELPTVIYEIDQ